MICVLAHIAWGHLFISGQGNWFHKVCYYDCGPKRFRTYDKAYRVSPDYVCPERLQFA